MFPPELARVTSAKRLWSRAQIFRFVLFPAVIESTLSRFCRIPPIAVCVLVLLAPSSRAFASCNAPTALKTQLQSKPTATVYTQLGTWFGDQKQYDCAAAAFASAAKFDPTSESLQYMWGLSLYSAGRDAEASLPLRRAAQLDPSDVRPHLALAGALDREKKTADAEDEWRVALVIDPDSETALDRLSQDLIDQKDYPGVVVLLDKPTRSKTRSPLQCLNLGMAYAGELRFDDAARVLRDSLNSAPDSLPIADELAMVLMLQGREDEAQTVFNLALEKHPDDQKTQVLYLESLVNSHSDKAPGRARELLAKYPDQWEVLYLNAVLEANDGNSQLARSHLEKSIARNPQYAESQKALGEILAKLDDLPGAKEHFEMAIALGDTQPDVQYDLARVLQKMGDTEHASERLKIYQQLKGKQSARTQAAGKAEEGDQAMAAGNPALAVSLFRDALTSDPDEPLLSYKLSQALDKTSDLAGEKAALQRALDLNPNLAEAQNQMGYLAVHAGDTAIAESYFRAAVRASPSYVVAWVNLAATLASEARWQDAKRAVDRALQIDPDNSGARQLDQAIVAANPSR